ncbi:hypothetical protein QNI19_16560 [Cytophagaceae bacterium DM2B3-1]|uniref:Uncharacterized protein n=1 Tax=Xanthocytophaga flava TaxID=3048013 RepID=A0ABT7CPG5_9BACT|nr:hypothetical protein [Xanthocytophaga flavus]MDJ1494559.1 hypothetical protein [Xanthocytophaga flavus]
MADQKSGFILRLDDQTENTLQAIETKMNVNTRTACIKEIINNYSKLQRTIEQLLKEKNEMQSELNQLHEIMRLRERLSETEATYYQNQHAKKINNHKIKSNY